MKEKKPKNNESLIKWDADKKTKRDLEREQQRAKEIVGDIYQRWKIDLCSKPRTRKEVIAYLYKLRDMVLDHVKEHAKLDMQKFNEFTYQIIERHITTLITAQITGHNILKQHIPVHLVVSGQVAIAKTEQFRNKSDLERIEFVKWFQDQPGFTGFSWKRVEKPMDIEFMLLAHYKTGDSWLVGTLINDSGLEDIPCYDDLEGENMIVIEDFVRLRETGSTAKAGESPSASNVPSSGQASPTTPAAGGDTGSGSPTAGAAESGGTPG